MSDPTCAYCGDGMDSIGTLNHIECVAALEAERDRACDLAEQAQSQAARALTVAEQAEAKATRYFGNWNEEAEARKEDIAEVERLRHAFENRARDGIALDAMLTAREEAGDE